MKALAVFILLGIVASCATKPPAGPPAAQPTRTPAQALEMMDKAILFAALPETAITPYRIYQTQVAEYVKGKRFFCYDSQTNITREYAAETLYTGRRSYYKINPSFLICKALPEAALEKIVLSLDAPETLK